MRVSELLLKVNPNMPQKLLDFYSFDTLPTRVPSLQDAAAELAKRPKVYGVNTLDLKAIALEFKKVLTKYKHAPIISQLPKATKMLQEIYNGGTPELKVVDGNIVLMLGETLFSKLSRVCLPLGIISWYDKWKPTPKVELMYAADIPNFVLTAHGGGSVGSCHRLDREYKYGQFGHLINPSVGHFYLTDGETTGDCFGTIDHRLARTNVFALWSPEGTHLWRISKAYGDEFYKHKLYSEIVDLAGSLGIEVITHDAQEPEKLLYGEPFRYEEVHFCAYQDLGEWLVVDDVSYCRTVLSHRYSKPKTAGIYNKKIYVVSSPSSVVFYLPDMRECHDCHKILRGGSLYVLDSISYCYPCYSNLTVLCSKCSEPMKTRNVALTDPLLCVECLHKLYGHCVKCDHSFHKRELSARGLCPRCARPKYPYYRKFGLKGKETPPMTALCKICGATYGQHTGRGTVVRCP